MNRSSDPTARWRFVAALMFVGTAGNLAFGILFIGGALTPVSEHAFMLVQLYPPAIERIHPTLRALGQLGRVSIAAFAYLAATSLISAALAVGLWNTRRWAAWITTIFMVVTIAANSYGIFRLVRWGGGKLSDLIIFGLLPAFVWATAYVAILWANWIGYGLLPITNAIGKLRRERVPLG